jgi:hypothetical protein
VWQSLADPDGHRHGDSHSDSYAYGYSNSYAYTDSYAYCYSHSYAYALTYGNSYAHTDSYAYVDAYGPAEIKPDTKAISDTAASAIGATRKRLCGNSRENFASSPRREGGSMICSGRRVACE